METTSGTVSDPIADHQAVLVEQPIAPGPPDDRSSQQGGATRAPGKRHTLDLLRGTAAMAVAVFHFRGFSNELGFQIPLGDVGETGVHLFFVLSGFFIGTSVLSPRVFDSREFGLNRIFRILPNYLFSMVLLLFLIDSTPMLKPSGWADIGTHLLLIHGWFPDYRVSITGVYWTLSVEASFYLFMLLAAGLIRRPRSGWWVATGMIVIALLYRAALWHVFPREDVMLNFGYKQLPGTLDLFGCGLLVALLMRSQSFRRSVARAWVRWLGLLASLVALTAALMQYHRYSPAKSYWLKGEMVTFWPLAFAISAAGVVLFFQQFEPRIGRWLDRSRLAFLGVISYSIYLYHLVVITAFYHAWQRSSGTNPWVVALLTLVAIIGLSSACYFVIERPFMHLGTRMRRSHAATAR